MLAQCVGAKGHVFGFDVQPAALDSTRNRLQHATALQQVTLLLRSHAELASALGEYGMETTRAAVFNLGYLPGSDKHITTLTPSTLSALEQSLQLLDIDGVLLVMAYRGHPAGAEESAHIEQWMQDQARRWQVRRRCAANNGPILYALHKTAADKTTAVIGTID